MNIRKTVITGAAALALVAGGTLAGAVAFASSGTVYNGCVAGTSRTMEHVYSRANPPACPSGSFRATWNAVGQQGPQGPVGPQGPQGPSGVTSMTQFSTNNASAPTGNFQFLGSQVSEIFDSNTVAQVTATVELQSSNGSDYQGLFGVCYQKVGSTFLTGDNYIFHQPITASPIAETVSAIVSGLSGNYDIGMCEASTSNLTNGPGTGTVIMAETAPAASLRHDASSAQHRPGRHG
jgi:hypothetical protein